MDCSSFFLLLCLSWFFLIPNTLQLQSSQTQILLQLRKHLEYPKPLEVWNNYHEDFCYIQSSSQVTVSCHENSVTELKIMGDKSSNGSNFKGFAIPNQTLSEGFSMDSFVTTLSRLTSLRVLSLISLGIWGPLSDKIHRLYSLEVLDLSSNFLFGSIPPKISAMVELQTLVLDGNFLNNSIPDMFNPLANLTFLSLKNNKLTGEIPQQFGELFQLQHLDLSINSLQGTPPTTLFSLPNLSYLNVATNMLSGSLPYNLKCGRNLGFIDISTNRFLGGLPSCLSSISNKRVVKFGENCLSVDPKHQHQESFCKKDHIKGKKSEGNHKGVLVGIIAGIIVVMVLLLSSFLIMFRRYCPKGTSEQHLLPKAVPDNSPSGLSSELLANARFVSQTVKLGAQSAPIYRLFSVAELREATSNFDNSTFLGEGSIGKLYKGRLENGTYVAIRCLALFKKNSIRNLKLRLDLLSKLRHPHLVCLLGHCIDDGVQDDSNVSRVFLVYEYVPNGSLHAHLSEYSPEKVLKWSERLAVLIGIAKAVHFLHTGIIPGFFSNRLKTNNIMLDEHRIAKLSDYGLSVIKEEIDKLEGKGDVRKSWQKMKLEDDVYSFGFIILETLVGPSVSGKGEAYLLSEMASFGSQDGQRRIVDPIVLKTSSQESLKIVISITNKCISPESSTHPSFEDVLWNLQYAAQIQATADLDQRSDFET